MVVLQAQIQQKIPLQQRTVTKDSTMAPADTMSKMTTDTTKMTTDTTKK